MNTSVEVKQTFEEKVFERIRSTIGELMDEEQLRKLVEKALDQSFFKETEIRDRWGSVERKQPPKIYALVQDLLKTEIHKCVQEHLEKNKEAVLEAIQVIVAQSFMTSYQNAMDTLMRTPFANLQAQLYNIVSKNNLQT